MCYAAPGPRCSTHTRATLDAAIKKATERPTDKNLEAVKTARTAWRRTPDGIESLKAEGHADLAAIYAEERATMLAAHKAKKTGVEPTRQRASHLTATDVVSREGWTKSALDRFLGEPDALRPNPKYRNAAPTRLFNLTRVLEVEASEDFATFVEKNAGRRAGAARAVETRTSQLLAEVEAIPITLREQRSLDQVRDAAFRSWMDEARTRAEQRGEYFEYSGDHSDDFSNRITVNYLRHERTTYDSALDHLYARVGKDQAYVLVKSRALGLIANAYPDLANECKNQGWEGVPAAA